MYIRNSCRGLNWVRYASAVHVLPSSHSSLPLSLLKIYLIRLTSRTVPFQSTISFLPLPYHHFPPTAPSPIIKPCQTYSHSPSFMLIHTFALIPPSSSRCLLPSNYDLPMVTSRKSTRHQQLLSIDINLSPSQSSPEILPKFQRRCPDRNRRLSDRESAGLGELPCSDRVAFSRYGRTRGWLEDGLGAVYWGALESCCGGAWACRGARPGATWGGMGSGGGGSCTA